jgi:hypothetical protein
VYQGEEDREIPFSFHGDASPWDIVSFEMLELSPSQGAVVRRDDGHFFFRPAQDFNGRIYLEYMAKTKSYVKEGYILILVAPINDAPEVQPGSIALSEDEPGIGTLVASDVEGDPLTFEVVDAPTKGTVEFTDASTGAFRFTPHSDANGTDTFTVRARDGSLASNVATFSVNIAPVEDAPMAEGFTLNVVEDVATTAILPATNIDGHPLTFEFVTLPTKGHLILTDSSTGAFSFLPQPDATGSDSFTFRVRDPFLTSMTATVAIAIAPVNDAPIATGLAHSSNQDTPFSNHLPASDVEGNALTFSIVSAPTRGSLTMFDESTGAFTYVPSAGAVGLESFSFRANDGAAFSNVATVSISLVDTQAPLASLVLTSPSPSASRTAAANVSLVENGPLSGVTYALFETSEACASASPPDDAWLAWPSVSDAFSTTVEASDGDGTKTICLRLRDGASLPSSASASFLLDRLAPSAPSVALVTPSAALPVTSTPSLQWSAVSCEAGTQLASVESAVAPASDSSAWQECAVGQASTLALSTGDGSKVARVFARDAARNISAAASLTVLLDTTAPTLAFVSLPAIVRAGVATSVSISLTDAFLSSDENVVLEWSTDGANWSQVASGASPAGAASGSTTTLTWNTPVSTASGTLRARLRDAATNLGTTLASVVVDGSGPAISGLSLAGGAANTTTSTVDVGVTLSDQDAVSAVCFLVNTATPPSEGNICWRRLGQPGYLAAVAPAATVTLATPVLLGYSSGSYTVYAFARDRLGNVSSLSASGVGTAGVDRATISFSVPPSPQVVFALAGNRDDLPAVPSTSDLSVPEGTPFIVKWRVQGASLGATPIALEWTSDGTSRNSLQSSLVNGANGACTIDHGSSSADDGATGCWIGTSPSNNAFLVSVRVSDTNGSVGTGSSSLLNSTNVRFLAGNTDAGYGASPPLAVVLSSNLDAGPDYADAGSLVVTKGGVIYFRDWQRGIVRIDPNAATTAVLVRRGSSKTGDGGSVASATVMRPYRIALDANEDLLVLDDDRIRKITLSTNPPTISTFIGGGSLTTANLLPHELAIAGVTLNANATNFRQGPFLPLPNGDLLFRSERFENHGASLRRYSAATGRIELLGPFGGVGHSGDASVDLSQCPILPIQAGFNPDSSELTALLAATQTGANCASQGSTVWSNRRIRFDPVTLQALTPAPAPISTLDARAFQNQTLDGQIYVGNKSSSNPGLYKFNVGSNSWSRVVGNGSKGYCNDGVLVSNCPTEITDSFVDREGRIYVVDNGLIRFVDTANRFVTIAGQRQSAGNGGSPLAARFSKLTHIKTYTDMGSGSAQDKAVLYDSGSGMVREFTLGGTIEHVAGTGSGSPPVVGSSAATSDVRMAAWSRTYWSFGLDAATGNIYSSTSTGIGYIRRDTGVWTSFVGTTGGSPTPFDTTPGASMAIEGANVGFSTVPAAGTWQGSLILGENDTSLVALNYRCNASNAVNCANVLLNLYRKSDGRQTHLAGIAGGSSGFGTTFPVLTENWQLSSILTQYSEIHWDQTTSKWLLAQRDTNTIRGLQTGENVATVATTNVNINGFAHRRASEEGLDKRYIYYCGNNGTLYKKDITSSASGPETAYVMPFPAMKCDGHSVQYSATRDSLVFIYTLNGLPGVAEIISP